MLRIFRYFFGANALLGCLLFWLFALPSTERYQITVETEREGVAYTATSIFEIRSYRDLGAGRSVIVGTSPVVDVEGAGWLTIPLYVLAQAPALAEREAGRYAGRLARKSSDEPVEIPCERLGPGFVIYWHSREQGPEAPHRVAYADGLASVSRSSLRMTRLTLQRTQADLVTRIVDAPPWLEHLRHVSGRGGMNPLLERAPMFLL